METTIYEKKIIGGIVAGKVKPITLGLVPSDMQEFGPVLEVCLQLEAEGKVIDADLLAERAVEETFYSANDYALFARSVPSASVVFESVDKVKAASLQSFLRTELAEVLTDETLTGPAMLSQVKGLIETADGRFRSLETSFISLEDVTPKVAAVLDDMHKGISYAIPTGFDQWDLRLLDGFSKGDLHVIVGMTGHGKSALALNCARKQALDGYSVGIVSREMSDVENVMRIQSSHQQIPKWQMRKGIYDRTYEALKAGMEQIKHLPISFDVTTTDVETLALQVKRMVEQDSMQILYVDYLQLVGSKNKRGSRAEEVAAVSRNLKLIAMENNIPVVALSQFSRGALHADVFDLLSYLKESSGIEQDSSTVSYIQVDNSNTDAKVKPAKLIVLKNRNGSAFQEVLMDYKGETYTFTEGLYQK